MHKPLQHVPSPAGEGWDEGEIKCINFCGCSLYGKLPTANSQEETNFVNTYL